MTRTSIRALVGSRTGPGGNAWRRIAACVLAICTAALCVAGTVNYQYDELGRLRKVVYPDGKVTDYALDPAGNRTSVNTALASLLQFTGATFSVGEAGPNVTITVSRSGSSTGAVSVAYATSNGTASAGSDYVAASGTLNWAAGDTANKSFTVSITDDSSLESNETVNLALSSPGGGAILGAPANAVLTITDNDTPVPGSLQFSAATYSVGEGGATATITVTRTGGSAGTVGINYATTTGGTATAGSDYTTSSGTLSWAAGVSGNKTFTIPILEDSAVEGNETVNLTLSTPTGGATLGSPATAQLTITDNDVAPAGAIQFLASTATVAESGTSVTLTARRTGGSNGVIGASYSTANGTATAGSDYTAVSGASVSWANGDTADKTISIPITSDATFEGSENFTVTLSAPTGGATIGSPSVSTVTITDSNSPPSFTINDVTVNEGAGTATLTVTKTGNTALSHQVTWGTSNGTAVAPGDYTAGGGTLTFAAATTTQSVTVSIVNDTSYEGTTAEAFNVVLSAATGGATIGDNTGVISITENDTAPSFSISSASVNENAASVSLTVSLSAASAVSHQVSWATANGTATAGSDYTTSGAALTFSAGVTSQTVTVPLIDDSAFEGSETFTVGLSGATGGATIAGATGTVTINDNEVAPTFSINSISVNENAGTATLTVTRGGATGQTNQVSYATTNGSAVAGSDFTGISTPVTLTFAAGVTTQNAVVTLTDDSVYEGTEGFSVLLSSPTGGATITTGTGGVTLLENDGAPSFSINSVTVNEATGTASLTVTKSGSTSLAHSVNYASSGGTATAGVDYTAISLNTLTFQPADTTKTITVNAINDSVFENGETYNVVLSSPTSGATIASATGPVTIADSTSVSFSMSAVSQGENTNSMTLTITKSGATNFSHAVSYATANGSATAGSDYTAVSGSHTFTAGETSFSFSVPLLLDSVYEGPETFVVNLSGATNGATIATPSVTHTLTDLNPPFFEITNASYSEGAGTVTVTITKTGATLLSHTVSYANGGGTATAGADYQAFSGNVTFAPADTSKTFSMTINEDSVLEGNETVLPAITAISNGGNSMQSGVLTILDNEAANTVNIGDVTLEGNLTGGYTNQAYYSLTLGGDIVASASSCSGQCSGAWINPKTNMSNYQARAINNGCLYTGGISNLFNTWLNLGTSPQWGESLSSQEPTTVSDFCTITIQISAVANPGLILDSATVTFNLWTGP